MLRKLLEEYEKWGLKVNLDKTFYMGCGIKTEYLILEDQKGSIKGCEEFDYLGVRIDKEDRQDSDIKNTINKGRATIAMLNSILWDRNITKEVKLQIYNSMVRSTVTYGADIWKLNKNLTSKLMYIEMNFLTRSARHSRLEKIRNTVNRKVMNVKNSVIDYVKYKQLNWYGHIRRMPEERIRRRVCGGRPAFGRAGA